MAIELGRYGTRDIMNVTVLNYNAGKLNGDLKWYMDFANTASNEWTSEQVYAYGGRGRPRRISFQSAKEGMLTLSTQIFTFHQIAHYSGNSISSTTETIPTREIQTVTDNVGTLEISVDKTPVDVSGDGTVDANDVKVYPIVNGIEDINNAATVSSVTGSTIVVTGVSAGDEVAVYYNWTTTNNSPKIQVTANDFPDYCTIIGDTIFVDEVKGTMEDAKIVFYKAKLNPNFTFQWSNESDPTALEMQFDLFPSRVNNKELMMDIILYDE